MKSTKPVGLIQIKLDLDLYKKLKIYCVEAEIKLRDVVEDAIRKYLENE